MLNFGHVDRALGPMRVLDMPSDNNENIEHSNVIPVLPVQSRDLVKTGRTSRRRRREAVAEHEGSRTRRSLGQRSSAENALMPDRDDVNTDGDQRAAILVSHYVTGQFFICISFALNLQQNICSYS